MKRAKVIIGIVVALAIVVGLYFVDRYWIAPATTTAARAESDHPLAPEFSVTSISGSSINLKDYRGKVVLLDFWATWCGPCRIEIPGFVELQTKYRDQGLVIIGISDDSSVEPVHEFYNEFNMNYSVAMDNDKIGALYGGIVGLPTTFLIGRDGRIYAKYEGATDMAVFEAGIKQLLGTDAGSEVTDFKPSGPSAIKDIQVSTPAEVNSEVSGVDLSKLTAEQKKTFETSLEKQNCTCNCKMNVMRCRKVDPSCQVSLKLARDAYANYLKSPHG